MVVGYVAIFAGCMGTLLPFVPGILLILLGLSILSAYSRSMHRHLAILRAKHPQLMHALTRMEMWVADTLHILTHVRTYVEIPIRNGKQVFALVEHATIHGTQVAVVLHGARGTIETPATQALAEMYRQQGCTVVRFDAYDGLGESEGTYTSFTPTGYLENLEDVLTWITQQSWATSTVCLAGHSVGGTVVATYAQKHSEQVSELVLLAPNVSGQTYLASLEKNEPEALHAWKQEGIKQVPHPLSGEIFGLGYGFVDDFLRYDVTKEAYALNMKVRIVRGADDTVVSYADVAQLGHAIGEHVEVVPVIGVSHTPTSREEIQRLMRVLL